MKKWFKKRPNIKNVLNGESCSSDDDRLEKFEKKLSNARAILFGYLLGHFLGILLDGFLGR